MIVSLITTTIVRLAPHHLVTVSKVVAVLQVMVKSVARLMLEAVNKDEALFHNLDHLPRRLSSSTLTPLVLHLRNVLVRLQLIRLKL